jgi:hypothetical protein
MMSVEKILSRINMAYL